MELEKWELGNKNKKEGRIRDGKKIGPPKWTEVMLRGKLQRLYFLHS